VSDFPRGETIELWRKSSEVGRWRQPKSSIAPRSRKKEWKTTKTDIIAARGRIR
jgi:hypothetical protein